MTIIKRILAALSLGIGAMVIAAVAAWLLVDDATLVAALDRQLQSVADIRISHQGDARITRTLSPTLSVNQLVIENRNATFRAETESLQAQLSLPRLLLGQLDLPVLHLGDTRITLMPEAAGAATAADSAATREHTVSAMRFRPLLHDVQIGNISVVRGAGKLHLPAIDVDEIAVSLDPDSEALAVSGQIGLADEVAAVRVTLPDIFSAAARQKLGFSLAANTAHFKLGAEGEIALDQVVPAVDAAIRASAVDLATLPVGIDALAIPGTLVASARLAGPVDQPALDDISAVWQDSAASQLKLEGRIGDVAQLDDVDLHAAGSLSKPLWLAPLLPDSLGSLDSAGLDTRVSGAWKQLAVSDMKFQANTGHGLDVTLSGGFDIVPASAGPQPQNIELALTFTAPTTRAARVLLFDQVPELGAINGKADVRADTDVPGLEHIVVRTRDKAGIETDLSGSIARFPLDPDKPNSGYDLDVVMKAASASLLAKRAGMDLSLTGPVNLAYRIEGDTRALALNHIRLTAGEKNAVLLGAQGRLLFGDWGLPDPLASVDLELQANSRDSASLDTLTGHKLPELGALSAQAQLHTVAGKHRIDKLEIRTSANAPVTASLDGHVGDVRFFPRSVIEDVRLKAQATATDSAQLNSVFGLTERIPALGPVVASASIQDKDKRLWVESASVRVGDTDSPAVQATGYVEDLLGAARTRWDVKLNIGDQSLVEYSGQQEVSVLGALVGSMVIANSGGPLGIESLNIRSTQTEPASLSISGRFGDFSKPETLSLTASLTAADLQRVGAVFDRKWPAAGPVDMQSAITHSGNVTSFDTRVSAGEIRLEAAISAAFGSSPVQVNGTITAHNFFFPELLTESSDSGAERKAAKGPVFSRTPLDMGWRKNVDMDLSVDIASFSKINSNLESARFVVTQKRGHLSISPATLVYPRGQLELDLQVDAQDPPRVSFKAYGKNLNPWQTLEVQQGRDTVDSDLDVDIDVNTSGRSAHEIAANLDGKAYITIQNGKVERVLLDVMVFDVVGWTISKATREKYYDIDCGVADLAARQGVITTNAFLLDSKKMTIAGQGSIDLGREQIDYALLPRKKALLNIKADPVKITGKLNDPSVRVIPWKSAAATYGGLVFAPYIFVGVVAADYLSNALGFEIGPKSSPCQDYEKQHGSAGEAPEK